MRHVFVDMAQRQFGLYEDLVRQVVPPPRKSGTRLRVIQRPHTRGDCKDGHRPCPFVSCRYNLLIDVDPRTGRITEYYEDLETSEPHESCALDVADRGPSLVTDIADILKMSKTGIVQIESAIINRLGKNELMRDLADGHGPIRHPEPSDRSRKRNMT